MIEGTFELLNHENKGLKPIDVREFARTLVEVTGDPETDAKSYVDLLPKPPRERLENDEKAKEEFMVTFNAKDLKLYQNHNLW